MQQRKNPIVNNGNADVVGRDGFLHRAQRWWNKGNTLIGDLITEETEYRLQRNKRDSHFPYRVFVQLPTGEALLNMRKIHEAANAFLEDENHKLRWTIRETERYFIRQIIYEVRNLHKPLHKGYIRLERALEKAPSL